MTSFNPTDVAERFCQNCRTWHRFLETLPPYEPCGVVLVGRPCRTDVSAFPCGMHPRR